MHRFPTSQRERPNLRQQDQDSVWLGLLLVCRLPGRERAGDLNPFAWLRLERNRSARVYACAWLLSRTGQAGRQKIHRSQGKHYFIRDELI